MKKIITLLILMTVTSTAYATSTVAPKKKRLKVVAKGAKAALVYDALNADVTTKNRAKFSVDIKKVGPLRCAKLTKKADTSVVKHKCTLKGKKVKNRRARRNSQQ